MSASTASDYAFGMDESCSSVLVVGGGIAGIQASLELANAGVHVALVERGPTIGGHMAMFDKTFPTLDCAACILTPKMVEVGQHDGIELLTCSELVSLAEEGDRFRAVVSQHARRVDLRKCTGCGTCAEKCPVQVASEFEACTTLRKAIYMPFPQAVPNKYLIDAAHCTHVATGKCGACVKFCPVEGCIDLDAVDTERELLVDAVIAATGFQTFNPSCMKQYGYGILPNVVTSLELERLVNASGPTGGTIRFRVQDKKQRWIFKPDGPQPESLAIIHCIGSRDELHHPYCSKVCCMYSLKLAHLIHEKLPDARITEYFIDIRAFGKGYEEFYDRIRGEGVTMIRGRTATVEAHGDKLLLRSEDILNDRIIDDVVDMVVLAVGLEPRDGSEELARLLGVERDKDGWFLERHPVTGMESLRDGVFLAGVCQGPRDIPDSVAHASAAASAALKRIASIQNRMHAETEFLHTEHQE
jgi:heterodisulfide reductase subunit A